MRTFTTTRMHFIIGSGALLAASACSSGTSRRVLPAGASATGNGRDLTVTVTKRTGVSFPQRRPDGSFPAKHFGEYRPKLTLDATGRQIAGGTVCPQTVSTGCVSAGTPDLSQTVANNTGYVWSDQNYLEVWDATSGTLLTQHYATQLVDGSWQLQVYGYEGTAVTAVCPGPSAFPSEGPFQVNGSNGPSVAGTISLSQGTFSANATDGSISASGTVSGGTYTASTQRGLDPPLIGRARVQPWMASTGNCLFIGLAGALAVVILHVLVVAVTIAVCDLGPVACISAGALLGGILGVAWDVFKNDVNLACGGAGA